MDRDRNVFWGRLLLPGRQVWIRAHSSFSRGKGPGRRSAGGINQRNEKTSENLSRTFGAVQQVSESWKEKSGAAILSPLSSPSAGSRWSHAPTLLCSETTAAHKSQRYNLLCQLLLYFIKRMNFHKVSCSHKKQTQETRGSFKDRQLTPTYPPGSLQRRRHRLRKVVSQLTFRVD